MKKQLFNVYIKSRGVRYILLERVTHQEAARYCSDNLYCFEDENGFVWDLDFEEC